ncbi:truncated two component, sigma54 specific, transcriptional regulator, Fis family protein (plasmid) [Aminobacter sp. Y103A]|nr:truncated two component, sigma54 specific, transcriptional regulator, Fis family protein [Aminobacter sp. SS-2016]
MNVAMLPERARVGLVEDDPVMGGSIVQRLELEGWDVTWWQTGGEAVAGLGRVAGSLDLVICDIRQPDMSGEAVFEEMARQPNAPPFLFVTGFAEIDQAVRLMRSGAVDFMTKPFAMDDFLKRIAIGRRTMRAGMRPARRRPHSSLRCA